MGEAVRETVDRCERLIASLLLLARSEAATGREEPVDLAALAADCITDLHARAQDAAGRDPDRPRARLDARRAGLLERMIANLIDNGDPPQRARRLPRGQHRGRSTARRCCVVPNGGARIDPEEAQTLTEPFRRLGRSVGGFGLGLSIVARWRRRTGGRSRLSAPETGGLEVRVWLPAFTARRSRAPD